MVKFSLAPENGHPQIVLQNTKAKVPVSFTGSDSDTLGSIYFVTAKGRTWLTGEPESVTGDENTFHAKWKLDNRIVEINLEDSIGVINFEFVSDKTEDILAWGFGLAATGNEYFTGLFERTVDGVQSESWKEGITQGMDLRGQQVEMSIKPTLSLYCPFYLSSNGYGLFIKGTWPGKFDFCKTDSKRVLVEFEGSMLEGVIYSSENPVDIIKKHSLNVGPTIVPPKWAFMPWRWRDAHENRKTYYDGTPVSAPYNSQLVEDILMMKAFDIPCGAYWVDRPWATGESGYDDFEWDTIRFPNPKQMINWIHKNDEKFLLWIAPWLTGKMKTEAVEKNYTQPLVKEYNLDSSKIALLDFTNKSACAWWQQNGIEKMLNQGVDGFKLDRAEENVPSDRELLVSDGRSTREVRNEYPVLYVKTVNESCQKIKGNDFAIFPRAGYSGSSAYGAFWGGDIGVPAEGLRTAIIAVQRSAIMGFPIWGSDIGGYWQGNFDREVCSRWLAFGCFTPIMEFGPTENRAPWDMPTEPFYDTELIATWRLYAKIHSGLAEYSHQLAEKAHETGMPPVRPLFLSYPEQKEAWTEWQNFMYGPDILIHAIWKKGESKTLVYLPKNDRWKDAWNSDKIYDGGQFVEIETPMHKIPIFIRVGSEINLGDLNELYKKSMEIASKKPDLKMLEKTIDKKM